MKLKEPVNPNYAAIVVVLDKLIPLAGCDNVQGALIFGNQVIVGNDAQAGDVGLFFPLECALSEEFLSANNLYRPSKGPNVDPTSKGGFFEAHGRVRCVKFRGHKSEGFYVPLTYLNYLDVATDDLIAGTFDAIGEHEICRKYVPRCNPGSTHIRQGRKARLEDAIVNGQFRFHIDTEQLCRNIHKINPTDIISISDKWHGTSAIYANILVNLPVPWWKKALSKVGLKFKPQSAYTGVWSSRRVIKGLNDQARETAVHFYDTDIWGVVGQEVFPVIPKGYTVYGEIVGYTPSGEAIQPGYHYGCAPGEHKFLVYRITFTNVEGKVAELGWRQMQQACTKWGLEMVKTLWYGEAQKFTPQWSAPIYDNIEDWHEEFLQTVQKYYAKDQLCEFNNCEVPAEGVVVRVEKFDSCEAYKLKNYSFLERETKSLDKGVVDMETLEGEENGNAEQPIID